MNDPASVWTDPHPMPTCDVVRAPDGQITTPSSPQTHGEEKAVAHAFLKIPALLKNVTTELTAPLSAGQMSSNFVVMSVPVLYAV